ncbi:MAG: hypothetical protein KC613_25115, partial [Myxococcales bacterium]|nr:hypothetical protein [Myxococcales bacterium]
ELFAAVGQELLVARSRGHPQGGIAYNGGQHPNLVGVYPNADGAAGLSNYAGRCQGEPCSFYLSDLEGSNSPCGVFQPSGDTRAQDALYRRATACGDEYNDAPDGRVEQGGYVLCSTNDVGPGPARSCQEVLARGSVQNVSVHGISGPYLLDGDGDGPAEPYMGWCDQHTHGGGWDLAMQLSGEGWGYADPVWTNAALVPAEVVSTEAFIPPPVRPENGKYRPFLGGAVGAVMVRFQRNTPGDASVSILLEAQRPIASLLALFTDGGALRPAGRPAWFNALGPLLQENCLAEGVNLTVGNVPAARLGILGNNEPDCVSVDSMYGVGFNTAAVCPEFMGTAGVCARNRGSASTPAWLFVRGAR